MPPTRFVKPGEGRRVRVPFAENLLVPESGMHWPAGDPFLIRRLNDGDLVVAEPPAEAPSAPADPPTAE